MQDDVNVSSEVFNNLFNNPNQFYEKLPNRIFNRTNISQLSQIPNVATLDFIGPWLNGMKYHRLFFEEKTLPESIAVIHMKHVMVGRQCIFYDNNSYYYVRPTCQFEYANNLNGSKRIVQPLESIIAICHLWTHNYAHMVFDVLVPISLIPQSIIDASYIVVTSCDPFVFEILKVFGFTTERVLFLRQQDLLDGNNVYTVDPHSFYNLQRVTLEKFRQYCVRKYSLDQITPFRFCMFNRKGSRSIANFDEVFFFLEKTFPQYRWENRTYFDQAAETILYFNEILLFFGPHGADFASMVFLQESAVVCEIQANTFVSCYLIISNLLGFHHIIGRLPLMDFDTYSYNIFPLTVANQMIEQALQYIV